MDFTLTTEQEAIRELSGRILGEQLPPARLRELEAGDWFADDVWAELAKADLLGLSLPEAHGGGGYGLLEVALVAEQIGRAVAPLPYLSCIVGSALPIAAFGTPEQQGTFLPGVIAGTELLALAAYESTDLDRPGLPTTQATAVDGGWRLDGSKSYVVAADRVSRILLAARTGEAEATAFLVDPTAPGVTLRPEVTVTGEPQWTVLLDSVTVGPDAVLGEVGGGRAVLDWTFDRLTAALCATQIGVCEEAVAITARYVSEREQFGSKLGTFQAVGHRVADAYIDTEGIRLTALQAIWRLDAGMPAHDELMVAKYWAAEGAQRVVHAAQHLHGGIGMDLDYPIHRYFRWAKVLELTLGGASPSLLRLGASLTSEPAGSA
ncbi:MAG: acyl-CoA/acyl-ACP dehydrogenase [Actinomycetota bacterium]|nr:acyl-CoA/acyl-ACP dehydrogenase [Actinomycetota bacterium]